MVRVGGREIYLNCTSGLSREGGWARPSPSFSLERTFTQHIRSWLCRLACTLRERCTSSRFLTSQLRSVWHWLSCPGSGHCRENMDTLPGQILSETSLEAD